jgi:hypothetical protein
MSFLRRRADAPLEAAPGAMPGAVPGAVHEPPPGGVADDTGTARRPTRAERKAQKAEQAAAAELAARVARAQRRLAQATGPLPVVPQRRSADDAVSTE